MLSLRSNMAIAFFVAALGAGCSSKSDDELPTTYEVKGKVKFANGKPYPGGSIELRSPNRDEQFRMAGRIDADGEFTIKTIGRKQNTEGAISGDFHVTLIPDQGDDQTGVTRKPMELKTLYKIEPRDGFELIITVP